MLGKLAARNTWAFGIFHISKRLTAMAQLKGLVKDIPQENRENKGNKSHVRRICNRSYVRGTGLFCQMKTHNVLQLDKFPKRPATGGSNSGDQTN